MRNYNAHNEDDNQGRPANVPMRHYDPEDRIALAEPTRPASTRAAIPGINCPDETSSWDDIRAFRAKWGLPPVVGE